MKFLFPKKNEIYSRNLELKLFDKIFRGGNFALNLETSFTIWKHKLKMMIPSKMRYFPVSNF